MEGLLVFALVSCVLAVGRTSHHPRVAESEMRIQRQLDYIARARAGHLDPSTVLTALLRDHAGQ